MKLPVIEGVIRRRLLLNYRIDPNVVAKLLPERFRPKLVGDFAVAGICLIRLERLRPKGLPAIMGLSSENSAHRFAVEWTDAEGNEREVVYISRRDTDSRMSSLVGGRLFPGVHQLSNFRSKEEAGQISIEIQEDETPEERRELLSVQAKEVDRAQFPKDSIFESLGEASALFEAGCLGYSARPGSDLLDGLCLKTEAWSVSPLAVSELRSSFFDDENRFPVSKISFDHGLLMRDIDHEWHAEPAMQSG